MFRYSKIQYLAVSKNSRFKSSDSTVSSFFENELRVFIRDDIYYRSFCKYVGNFDPKKSNVLAHICLQTNAR